MLLEGGNGSPSNTVVSETTAGQTPDPGAAETYSRGDHTHGTPSGGGSSPDPSDTVETETSYDQAADAGASSEYSRGDHTHGTPQLSDGVSSASYGQAAFSGSVDQANHSDHRHGLPTHSHDGGDSNPNVSHDNLDGVSANDHHNETHTPSVHTFVGASVTYSLGQNVANVTTVYLLMDTEVFDTNAFHDPSANTSRLTAPFTGYYHIIGNVIWTANTAGTRYLEIHVNRTSSVAMDQRSAPTGVLPAQNISAIIHLTAGDYVELAVTQNSGGTRVVIGNNSIAGYPIFSIEYLGV